MPTPTTLCSNLVKVAVGATLYHFGVLSSTMHNAWVRSTCGRLESRLRYSKDIVYNNFPWPDLPEPATGTGTGTTPIASGPGSGSAPTAPSISPSQKKRAAIESTAQSVLDARASFPEASLADLYDPLAMPPALTKAHQQLDKVVDAAYAYKGQPDDASRVAFLFLQYLHQTTVAK